MALIEVTLCRDHHVFMVNIKSSVVYSLYSLLLKL